MLRPKRKVIVSVHGIESHGLWEMDLAPLISEQGWIYYPLHYGRFRLHQFLLPWKRDTKVKWFRDEYNKIRSRYGDVWPSVIAHSFGTYIVTKALETYEGIRLDKLILCGSIVRPDFNWEKIISRKQITSIENDFGKKDFWAGVSAFVASGFGSSGKRGFVAKHNRLVDREFENYTHGSIFGYDHYEKFWIPFLKEALPFEGEEELPTDYEEPVSPMDAARWSAITYFHQYVYPAVAAISKNEFVEKGTDTQAQVERIIVLIPEVPSESSAGSRSHLFKKLNTTAVIIGKDPHRAYEKFDKNVVDIPRILESLKFLDKRQDDELIDAVEEFREMLEYLVNHSIRYKCPDQVEINQLADFKSKHLGQ